jgi:type III secretory pathway component EscS
VDNAVFTTNLVAFMMDVVILAGIPLAAATVIGLLVSFFQAITQIQDQTFSQTVKISAIMFVLLVFGRALTSPLMNSTTMVFENFGRF